MILSKRIKLFKSLLLKHITTFSVNLNQTSLRRIKIKRVKKPTNRIHKIFYQLFLWSTMHYISWEIRLTMKISIKEEWMGCLEKLEVIKRVMILSSIIITKKIKITVALIYLRRKNLLFQNKRYLIQRKRNIFLPSQDTITRISSKS